MAFHTYDIIGMLVANEQFKFSSAIRAVVLVQGHRRFPPMNGNCFVITNIVVPGLDYVKMHFDFFSTTIRTAITRLEILPGFLSPEMMDC